MKSSFFVFSFAFYLLVCGLGGKVWGNESIDGNQPMNVVVILLDDAGWRDVGFAGNGFIETPNMDRLASEGMIFTQAYATHPFCTPSRQSMITGQYPARTAWMRRSEVAHPTAPRKGPPFSPAVAHAWTQLRPEFTSLAEALKQRGYATAHIGKWHFGVNDDITPEHEGFEVNFGGGVHVGAVKNHFYPFEGLPQKVEGKPGDYLTDRLTREAIGFVREHKDGPFFLELWHYAPHTPIQAPGKLVEKYRAKRRELGDLDLNPTYAAMIEAVDTGVGKLMQVLKDEGLAERTVVFLTSDNGAQATLGSVPVTSVTPMRGQKGWITEGGIRVPLTIRWPGVTKAGTQTDVPVTIMDTVPTILDLAGAKMPADQPVDGTDLRPLLAGGDKGPWKKRPLFWYDVKSTVEPDGAVLVPVDAIREGDLKLIHDFFGRSRLFNVMNDPGETRDLSGDFPEKRKALEEKLGAWFDEMGVAPPVPNAAYDPDFVVPREVKSAPGGKTVEKWAEGGMKKWRPARMVKTKYTADGMTMTPAGIYPEIVSPNGLDLPAGKYAVIVRYKFPTSGRFRFHWVKKEKQNGVIEFDPNRDGKVHEVAGVFEADAPIEEFRIAAPTHLRETGHYDPAIQGESVEIQAVEIRALDK